MEAEAMHAGFEVLGPHPTSSDIKAKGTIVIGTVKCAKNNRCVMKDDMFPLYFENDPEIVKRAKKIGKRLGNL